MEILFLGLMFKQVDEEKLLLNSRVGLNNSVNTFQWNIIDGLSNDESTNIKILNSIPTGNYPLLNRKLFIKSKNWKYKGHSNNKEIGFINFYFIKDMVRLVNYMNEVKLWCKDTKGKERYILVYDLYIPFMRIVRWIKKKYPDVKTNIIIGDLPNQYSHTYNKYKGTIKGYILSLRGKISIKLVSYFDSCVFLTKHMKDALYIKDKPYIVVEGIVNSKYNYKKPKIDKMNKKIIMYAGTLNKQYGIDTLIEAFRGIDKNNYELWLCGNGDMDSEIKKIVQIDKRIKYYGYVTKDKLLCMERHITAYINPRQNTGLYTKYSFPSKTIEYMASGKPIIMYKLDGVPDEYDNYLFYVENNKVTSLRNKIIEICEMDMNVLQNLCEKNQDFIRSKKNNIYQATRIINLLKRIKD